MRGKVYLIGAGPGKPDLITVRGSNILKEADVVIYDYLVDRRLLEWTNKDAELISTDTLGKKRNAAKPSNGQNRINSLMVKRALEGKRVARLKNGDPFIFSRCREELDALNRNRIEFEVVPGVTAANAGSCLSGTPLTDRRFASSCVFITGHESSGKKSASIDWDSLAKAETIILYMAVSNLGSIVKRLITLGKDKNTPISLIQDVSLPTQKVVRGTLRDIKGKAKKQKIRPPALIIIGKVAELEDEFNWLRKNKRILFTGLSQERFFMRGTYFHLPLIKIEPLEDYEEFDNHLRNIEDFDWIVFASRYGVEYFFKRLRAIGYDSRVLSKIKIAAVGSSTGNRLLDFGVRADLVPRKESSKGLIEALSGSGGNGKKINLLGKKIFLPRSDLSDKGLGMELMRLGARVTSSYAYKNIMPDDLPDLDLNNFDEIMFTSPSTVRNFKKRYKRVPKNVRIRCIGDVTLKEAKRCNLLD